MGDHISTWNNASLSESNWLQYAMSNYDNPHLSSISEFEEDLKRFSYILLLLNKYKRDKEELNLSLIVNHIIILSNCFGVEATRNMLLFKLEKEHGPQIKTIMYALSIYGRMNIDSIDPYILEKFKEL